MTKVKFNLYFLVVFGFERSLLRHAPTFPQVTAQNQRMFFKYSFYSFKTTYNCHILLPRLVWCFHICRIVFELFLRKRLQLMLSRQKLSNLRIDYCSCLKCIIENNMFLCLHATMCITKVLRLTYMDIAHTNTNKLLFISICLYSFTTGQKTESRW